VRRQIIRLDIAGHLQQRDVALRTVSAACRLAFEAGAPARTRAHRRANEAQAVVGAVISSVGEAFNNIALHGYRGRPPGLVQIKIVVGEGSVTVEMRDYGRSFDPCTAAPPDLDALPESGMGVFILTHMMDEIDYRPGRPNVLRLVKRLT
jgi:serine/threonine-protein kinase RsbW